MQCFADDKGVALSVAKFSSSNDVDLFLGVGLKVSITNVSGPDFEIIKFGNKSEKLNTMEGDNF